MEHPSATEETLEAALDALGSANLDEGTAARVFDRAMNLIRPHHSSIFWGDRMMTLDKSAAFRNDPNFQRAIKSADSSTGENQYSSPDGITWRFNTLIWAARQAATLPGDFVECGVFEGDMSWVVTEMVDLPSLKKTFHLYDTFAGFSPEYSSEQDYPDAPQFFQIMDRNYRRPEIYQKVLNRFAQKPYVIIHRGPVPDTLNDSPAAIAYLHLDMNSPGPELAALEVLYDRISPGGVIVFDDYGWSVFRKQKEAADGFMASRGQTVLELPTGQGLCVKVNDRAHR